VVVWCNFYGFFCTKENLETLSGGRYKKKEINKNVLLPDVSGFRVDTEDGAEALGEGRQLRPVTKVEIVIVPEN
jgi:hypothetical protein